MKLEGGEVHQVQWSTPPASGRRKKHSCGVSGDAERISNGDEISTIKKN